MTAAALQPSVRLAFQPSAFSAATAWEQAPHGLTIQQMVDRLRVGSEYADHLRVWVGDRAVSRETWGEVVPAEGELVYVAIRPSGDGGKDVLRMVAMVVIAVVAWQFAPVLAGTGAAGASISAMAFGDALLTTAVMASITVVGNLALNALIPPPKPDFDVGGGLGPQRNQLTGSSNRFAPYSPIPRVFGKRRIFPLLAGRPYSETQGNDEYLRMALLVGWGPLKISDIRIGDTPLESFAGVEVEVREGWANDDPLTLYTRTINETAYNVTLVPSEPFGGGGGGGGGGAGSSDYFGGENGIPNYFNGPG